MEHILPGGGQGGDGAAMEGVPQGDDGASAAAVLVVGILPAELDHALVGLAAAVGKEGTLHAGAAGKLMSQLNIGGGVEEIGGMGQLGGLSGNGLQPFLVAVAKAVYADAGGKIDIFLSLRGVEAGALAVVNGHGKTAIGLHDALGV